MDMILPLPQFFQQAQGEGKDRVPAHLHKQEHWGSLCKRHNGHMNEVATMAEREAIHGPRSMHRHLPKLLSQAADDRDQFKAKNMDRSMDQLGAPSTNYFLRRPTDSLLASWLGWTSSILEGPVVHFHKNEHLLRMRMALPSMPSAPWPASQSKADGMPDRQA